MREPQPRAMMPTHCHFVQGLLQKDPKKRLGCGPRGVVDIMSHPFFRGVDWMAMHNKQVVPPFRPSVNVLDSGKSVRSWNEKDRAKLATVVVGPSDQVRYRRLLRNIVH